MERGTQSNGMGRNAIKCRKEKKEKEIDGFSLLIGGLWRGGGCWNVF